MPAVVELAAVPPVPGLYFDHELARDGEQPRDHRYRDLTRCPAAYSTSTPAVFRSCSGKGYRNGELERVRA